jgi:Bacterial cadherin-like domain
VTLTVTPINDAPVAANDSYTTNENTALTVAAGAILANDTRLIEPDVPISGIRLSDWLHREATWTATHSPYPWRAAPRMAL